MKKLLFLFAIPVLLMASWEFSAQEINYKIIVHPSNDTPNLSKAKVSQFLLKKASKWDGGTRVEPVDLTSNSPIRESLSRDIHGRSVASIKAYWQKQIFSGKAVPPPELSDDNAVIQFVKTHPGAIGYISNNAKLTDVKELPVL